MCVHVYVGYVCLSGSVDSLIYIYMRSCVVYICVGAAFSDRRQDEVMLTFAGITSLDVVNNVDVVCDVDEHAAESVDEGAATPVVLTFALDERNDLGFNLGTYAQRGEGSIEMAASLKNRLFGLAEVAELSGSVGTATKSPKYAASLLVPKLVLISRGGRDGTAESTGLGIDTKVFRQKAAREAHSSFTEAVLGWSMGIVPTTGRHELAYEFLWREVMPRADASMAIKREAGHNVKSAIRWTFAADSRDAPGAGDAGVAIQSQLEVAGIGPDSNFLRHVKHEMEIFSVLPVMRFLDTTLRAGVATGVLVPWQSISAAMSRGDATAAATGRSSSVCDRFYAGGALASLRGFSLHGAGPMDSRSAAERANVDDDNDSASSSSSSHKYDALGGDAMMSFFASLSFNFLPPAGTRLGDIKLLAVLREMGMHAHVFVNGANNMLISDATTHSNDDGGAPSSLDSFVRRNTSTSSGDGSSRNRLMLHGNSGYTGEGGVRSIAKSFINGFRVSAGAGVVLPTAVGNIEMNYCHVLRHQATDHVRTGFQLSFATPTFS